MKEIRIKCTPPPNPLVERLSSQCCIYLGTRFADCVADKKLQIATHCTKCLGTIQNYLKNIGGLLVPLAYFIPPKMTL